MRTGDPPPGANRGSTATANPRRARQLTSQAKRACFEVRGVPAVAHPSPTQRAVGRNLALDLVAAVGVGVTIALVATLLPTIARRGGLEPLGLAALAAAPFIANLLGAFAGRVGPRSRAHTRAHPGRRRARSLALLILADAAGDDRRRDRLLAQPLVRRPVPPAPVGRHVPGRASAAGSSGCIGMGRAAAGAIAALAGGIVATGSAARRRSPSPASSGASARSAIAGLRAPAADRPAASRPATRSAPFASARPRARRPRPGLLRRRAHRGRCRSTRSSTSTASTSSLADVGVIGILRRPCDDGLVPRSGASSRTGAGRARRDARRERDRAGVAARSSRSRRTSSCCGSPPSPAGSRAPRSTSGIAAVVSDHTSLASRAAAMAGWNAITGARGIVAAFPMSALLQLGRRRRDDRACSCAPSRPGSVSCSSYAPGGRPGRRRAASGAAPGRWRRSPSGDDPRG